MSIRDFPCLIFDFFDTIAFWDQQKIPKYSWRGKQVNSTNQETFKILKKVCPKLEFDEYQNAILTVSKKIISDRVTNQREISSIARYTRILQTLDVINRDSITTFAELASRKHMEILKSAVSIPDKNIAFLNKLCTRHHLILLSNFDDAKTLREILNEFKLNRIFQAVNVSEELGYRKPSFEAFSIALKQEKFSKSEMLFIGDSSEEDIKGANTYGISSAWVCPKNYPIDTTANQPTFIINEILNLT